MKSGLKKRVFKKGSWNLDDSLNFQSAKAFFKDPADSDRAKNYKKDNLSYFGGFRKMFKKAR